MSIPGLLQPSRRPVNSQVVGKPKVDYLAYAIALDHQKASTGPLRFPPSFLDRPTKSECFHSHLRTNRPDRLDESIQTVLPSKP